MLMELKCCMCGKLYKWYDGVFEKADPKDGVFINANSIKFTHFDPIPEREGEKLEGSEIEGNLDGMYINLCEECIRALLLKCCPSSEGKNCFLTD